MGIRLFNRGETEIDHSSAEVIFAAYGDMPYMVKLSDGRTDEQVLYQDIAPKIRERADIPFVIHVGDLGRPDIACTDSWLEKTKSFWRNALIKPVFFTPGDNDWTDCDSEKLAARTSELGRLEAIRRIFFSQPENLSSEWRYEQQANQPENQAWFYKGVRFVTQRIVSKDNGRKEVLLDDLQQAMKLADERDKQNQIWLDYAFEMAKSSDTKAVVVACNLIHSVHLTARAMP